MNYSYLNKIFIFGLVIVMLGLWEPRAVMGAHVDDYSAVPDVETQSRAIAELVGSAGIAEDCVGTIEDEQKRDACLHDVPESLGLTWLLNDPVKIDSPLLYRLDKDGKESYLLGTAHCIPISHFSESVLDVFKGCKSLVIENARRMTRADLEAIGGLYNNKHYETWWLHEHLAEPEKQHLERILKWDYGLKERDFMLWELSPKGASIYYTMAHHHFGMEIDLLKMFPGPIGSLETVQEAVPLAEKYLFTGVEAFAEEIRHQMQCGGKINNDFVHEQVSIYKQGFVSATPDNISDMNTPTSGLAMRNSNWVQRWDQLVDTLPSPTLFAVGCLHINGNYGLLSLLQKNGYSLTRLSHEPKLKGLEFSNSRELI